jgi:predicted DNA-binding protein (MmcQ/YjbR family)
VGQIQAWQRVESVSNGRAEGFRERLGWSRRGRLQSARYRHDVNRAQLRDHCLSFTGAEETFPFGSATSVFKVGGKMFALSQLAADSLRVSLKCEPALAEALRASHAAVLPGYHLNKRHWNTVVLDGSLPDGTLCDMIEDSYDLVVSKLPRADRRALSWTGDA